MNDYEKEVYMAMAQTDVDIEYMISTEKNWDKIGATGILTAKIREAIENEFDGRIKLIMNNTNLTLKFCIEAVKNKVLGIGQIPEKFMTAELCLEAVKNRGYTLASVPEALKTSELCLEAVKNHGDALQYVPEALKTSELCLEAVKNYGYALHYVPEALKTFELCLEAVKKGSYALKYVPDSLKEQVENAVSHTTTIGG